MILREALILIAAICLFAGGVYAYLTAFHGEAPMKEVLSTAFAALIGLYAGRALQGRLSRG
ncbi:MAG: hypothetical protein ABJ239_11285 [Erythrobacter sp.]